MTQNGAGAASRAGAEPARLTLLRQAARVLLWRPAWSVPAAMRTVRATLVVPSLFAVTDKVVGDPQMALFATFGGFATLIIAGFGGTGRDKLIAHAGLAVAGSLTLIIGTLASGSTWLATVVTVPVTFAIFFAGIGGPNAASGATAAMFAYVLPIVSAGGAATIPSRLEGWWLASAAGTIAVLLLSPRAPGSRLRGALADLAGELAQRGHAAAGGEVTSPAAMLAAKDRLRAAFTAAPFRPTGLAGADQAMSRLVQLLNWGSRQAGDAFDGHIDLASMSAADRELLQCAAGMLEDTRALLRGQPADPGFAALETARLRAAERLSELSGRAGEPDSRLAAAQAVHVQAIAAVARAAAADALIASRRAGFDETVQALASVSGLGGIPGVMRLVRRHATFRSVWFVNSLRGAVALAAAVAVADLSGVQHGFWVVLGTLSVLRTSAAATGSTALRALAGTVVGFAVGAALLGVIGTNPDALWAALPVAVAVAAYSPGTTPFLVGQAAFTITVVVLFNLIVPVGWTVGLLRIEDVAIGCAVSLAVGLVFWPRGASGVVADDIADAFRTGAAYLRESVEWALSELLVPPDAALSAATAAVRLDDAVRGFLTEQGSKRLAKDDLWELVNATSALRLTASTLAGLRPTTPATEGDFGGACLPLAGSGEYAGAPACTSLRLATASLAGFFDSIADELGRTRPGSPALVPPPLLVGAALPRRAPGGDGATPASVLPAEQLPHPHLLWVQEHLRHLSLNAQSVPEPALHMAEVRQRPWWR